MADIEHSLSTTVTGIDGDGRPQPMPSNSTRRTWWASFFILVSQVLQNAAYYGMCTNMVNYLKDQLREGAHNAANDITNWQGTCAFMPLLGAYLGDAHLGRYRTINCFLILSLFAYALLTMTATVKGLRPCDDSGVCNPSAVATGSFYVALYLIAFSGGSQPVTVAFGADQFDEADQQQQSSFFNWFYLSINAGALIGSSLLVWIQTSDGWGWGFGVPSLVLLAGVLSFFAGSPLYRHQPPGSSPLVRITQVVVAAVRKGGMPVPADKSLLHEIASDDNVSAIKGSRKLPHTDKFRFLDKAAVMTAEEKVAKNEAAASSWRLCTVTQVEELKCILALLPIWATGIVFSAAYTQMSTTFILQGDTMDRRLGRKFQIPAATLSIFDTISVMIWVPVYDRLIVPAARRFTGDRRGFSQLTRMGIGLAISIVSMSAAALLENARLRAVAHHGLYDSADPVPLSVMWQVPQYFIVGASEIFTFIGQMEFFYDQAPDAVRSLCSALTGTSFAVGNYLSTLLVTTVTWATTRGGGPGWIPDNLNRGHLDYFFWLLAALSLVNLAAYVRIAMWYTYKRTQETGEEETKQLQFIQETEHH